MPTIEAILTETRCDDLRRSYASRQGQEEVKKILRSKLADLYPPSEPYVTVINDIYYGALPSDSRTEREQLSEADRERVVIALLASQGETGTLAIHVYLALMTGVSPQEIAHILLLTGVYAGVSRFTGAMGVTINTLGALAAAPAINPQAIIDGLLKLFPVLPPPPANG